LFILQTLGARAAGELADLKQSDVELRKKFLESQQALETAWSDLACVRKEMGQKIAEALEGVRSESNEAREKWKRSSQQKAAEWNDKEKSLKESLHALRAEVARKEESYEWRIHALSEKERDLKSRLEQAESVLADERSSRSQAQAPLIEESRKLRELLREAEDQTAAMRNELRTEMDGLEKEKRELKVRLQEAEGDREKWKEAHAATTQKLARLETKYAEASASLELEKGILDQVKEENETLKAVGRKLKEENEKLRVEQNKCKEELASAQTRLEAAVTNARQALKSSSSNNNNNNSGNILDGGFSNGEASKSSSFAQVRLEREVVVLQAELVRASQEASEAVLRLRGMEELERMLGDLGKRHLVALEMLGEREQELKNAHEDLEDAKAMFRHQIEEVLSPMKQK
jgi:chromosome segregation ATPase